jgi:hypothetical protein
MDFKRGLVLKANLLTQVFSAAIVALRGQSVCTRLARSGCRWTQYHDVMLFKQASVRFIGGRSLNLGYHNPT